MNTVTKYNPSDLVRYEKSDSYGKANSWKVTHAIMSYIGERYTIQNVLNPRTVISGVPVTELEPAS